MVGRLRKAAELYVDEGNQIRFLPFGLALAHKLNELVLAVRVRLEVEREPVLSQLQATRVEFATPAPSAAQEFYKNVDANVSDVKIDLP